MDKVSEILLFFIKGYINVQVFDNQVYEELSLEEFLGKEVYLDLVSTNFSSKSEVIRVRNVLRDYFLNRRCGEFYEMNDAYCERVFNKPDILEIIEEMVGGKKQIYSYLLEEFMYPIYKKEIKIDLTNVRTEEELMGKLSKGLGFYRFPMEWKWLGEYLECSEIPQEIEITGIENIKKNFSGCYYLMIHEFDRVSKSKGCLIRYE